VTWWGGGRLSGEIAVLKPLFMWRPRNSAPVRAKFQGLKCGRLRGGTLGA